MEDEKQITEVTFEVTVRHYVEDDTPNPAEEEIIAALERHLGGHPNALTAPYDVESIKVERV